MQRGEEASLPTPPCQNIGGVDIERIKYGKLQRKETQKA